MANYAVRKGNLLDGWQIDVAMYVFRGWSNEQIAIEVLDANPDDKEDLKKKTNKVRKLTQTKNFNDFYKSMINEWMIHNAGKALCKLSEQVDHDQPWLANKAANDILSKIPKSMLTDEDESTVKIVIVGAPDLGTPDSEV